MNIAILDDLSSDREKAASCLLTYFSIHPIIDTVHICEFESGEAFLKDYNPGAYQFIIIDYYMNGMSGLDTAVKIRARDDSAILIFITTSRDYAIDGYRVKASGYLLKPFSYADLEELMLLVDMKKIRDEQIIEIDTGNGHVKVLLNDIIYCDITGHYTQIHTQNMGLLRFRMAFSTLAGLLSPYKNFLPCYRGCIINMKKVIRIEELSFCMENGGRIPFRKKEQALLMKQYTDFLFEKVRKSQN